MNLESLLQEITVIPPGEYGEHLVTKWFAVANTNGIVAYFFRESDALRFRLDYINRLLNPTEG